MDSSICTCVSFKGIHDQSSSELHLASLELCLCTLADRAADPTVTLTSTNVLEFSVDVTVDQRLLVCPNSNETWGCLLVMLDVLSCTSRRGGEMRWHQGITAGAIPHQKFTTFPRNNRNAINQASIRPPSGLHQVSIRPFAIRSKNILWFQMISWN